ncbi:MAG: CBS domain-containing protein, partial [Gemmataceae bacterium]|nr:CBS domain-containing protein [Gemmataceae bacterium]
MTPSIASPHMNEPIARYARHDFPRLRPDMTVQEALDRIRQTGLGEKIVYFYVLDATEKLVGVLPTRRLLTAPLNQSLAELMIHNVVAIPSTATVGDACEFFVLHKFLAFPIVSEDRRMVGVVDIGFFTDEIFDLTEHEQTDAVFEALGFRLSQVRGAGPVRAFRFRFPWLAATIASGTVCALLTSGFETTLAQSLVLAFFLTLVLGLGESVSIQSMTVTIQALRSVRPSWRWYGRALVQEFLVAVLLGL